MSNKVGRIFVVSSPSGGGKTTLAGRLLDRDSRLVRSISMTTRQPRAGEKEAQDYFFVSKEEFDRIKERDGFLESATVFGYQYGTPKAFVDEKRREGKDVLLLIDVQGAMSVKKTFPEAVLIFINPPSISELERRLRERATDSEETIQKRLKIAHRELSECDHYDHVIENKDLALAVEQLSRIIKEPV